MMGPNPLNQAVIAQALHDLRNGQLRRCKLMGFDEEELNALKHPGLVSILANATVAWCTVSVNRPVLRRLLQRARDVDREITVIDRMLKLGASTAMMGRFYGLTHREVALRRKILGLPRRKGRHRALNETQDLQLWHRWKDELRGQAIDPQDDAAVLEVAMHLAEDMTLPLAVVWAALKNWITEDLLWKERPDHDQQA